MAFAAPVDVGSWTGLRRGRDTGPWRMVKRRLIAGVAVDGRHEAVIDAPSRCCRGCRRQNRYRSDPGLCIFGH
jgi:hypothetical protein